MPETTGLPNFKFQFSRPDCDRVPSIVTPPSAVLPPWNRGFDTSVRNAVAQNVLMKDTKPQFFFKLR